VPIKKPQKHSKYGGHDGFFLAPKVLKNANTQNKHPKTKKSDKKNFRDFSRAAQGQCMSPR
jgi:hypothetical protein